MRAALATALERSGSYSASKQITAALERIAGVHDTDLAARLEAAIDSNDQVGDAFGVPERLRAVAGSLQM